MDVLAEDVRASDNPLDLLEELVSANDWLHNRSSDTELMVQVSGQWCDYHLCCIWQSELGAMYVSCHIEAKVPALRRAAVRDLLVAANERLWMGHFDLMSDDGTLMYRHTVPLRGTRGMSVEQLEDLMDTAIVESERLYPALQMVMWGGRPVAEALQAAMMETAGEA